MSVKVLWRFVCISYLLIFRENIIQFGIAKLEAMLSYLVLCFVLGISVALQKPNFLWNLAHLFISKWSNLVFEKDCLYLGHCKFFHFMDNLRTNFTGPFLIIENFGAKYLKYNTSFRFVYCLVQICLGQSAFSSFHSWSVSCTNNWQYSFCASTISHQRLQTIGDLFIIGAASDD